MPASAMKLPSDKRGHARQALADGAAHGHDAAHAHQRGAGQVVGQVFDAAEAFPAEAGVSSRATDGIAESEYCASIRRAPRGAARSENRAEKFAGRLRELAETPSINAISGGVDLARVIGQGGCVYFVGSMRNDIIKTVQRFLLVRLIQLAERRDRIAGGLRPVCIVLDEVKYHLSRPALEGLGAARDKGVHLVLAHQSLGDLRDCSKDLNPDAVVDAVVENCRIKICYRVMNPATAEWLAAMSGAIQVDDETRKIEKNIAQAETVMGERAIRQAERYYIDVNMLLNLPPSVSVVYGDGLPKFVSIRPLKVGKTPEAVKIGIVDGAAAPSGVDAIEIGDAQPQERYEARAIALE